MQQLYDTLNLLIEQSHADPDVIAQIKSEKSVPLFPMEARLLAYLQSIDAITYEQYHKLYQDFTMRYTLANQYLYLFDMSPRTFGQTWGEQHISSLFPQFKQATKSSLSDLYPDFDGEFDLWTNGIRIEVKACRANNTATQQRLSSRAYSHKEAKAAGFKYHYQQLKPSCCDVFIWIGVCKDKLLYWVLSSDELEQTGKLGSQHRNEHTGTTGTTVFEGQVFMTEDDLMPFAVDEKEIFDAVIHKGTK